MNKWCYWQTKCKEDAGKGTFTCTADLCDGRVFKCPYKSNEDRVLQRYPCSDYQKPKEQ